jgi:hypothetical protein
MLKETESMTQRMVGGEQKANKKEMDVGRNKASKSRIIRLQGLSPDEVPYCVGAKCCVYVSLKTARSILLSGLELLNHVSSRLELHFFQMHCRHMAPCAVLVLFDVLLRGFTRLV